MQGLDGFLPFLYVHYESPLSLDRKLSSSAKSLSVRLKFRILSGCAPRHKPVRTTSQTSCVTRINLTFHVRAFSVQFVATSLLIFVFAQRLVLPEMRHSTWGVTGNTQSCEIGKFQLPKVCRQLLNFVLAVLAPLTFYHAIEQIMWISSFLRRKWSTAFWTNHAGRVRVRFSILGWHLRFRLVLFHC